VTISNLLPEDASALWLSGESITVSPNLFNVSANRLTDVALSFTKLSDSGDFQGTLTLVSAAY
jgi:hypothetical protein